jgi:hypothetical protein
MLDDKAKPMDRIRASKKMVNAQYIEVIKRWY